MRLMLNYFTVLVFACTGFLAFYLVIINFIEHLSTTSKGLIWFQVGCSVVIAVGGAFVAWRKKIGAAIVLAALLALYPIWSLYVDLPTGTFAHAELPESAPTVRKFFPAAYVVSVLLAIIQLILPAKNRTAIS